MSDDKQVSIPLVFMVTVINRGSGGRMSELFARKGVTFNLLTMGIGTASSKIMDYLGLGESEKDILFSTMPLAASRTILKLLKEDVGIAKPGHGIAFTIPLSSICGHSAYKRLQGMAGHEEGEIMENSIKHDLIIAIANRGFSDDVMDAAKSADAKGGTVIHARGTGLKEAEKFFGITIQPEKELVMILAKTELKQGIMEAIAAGAGVQTEAKALVFSLPVNGVAGLSMVFPDGENSGD